MAIQRDANNNLVWKRPNSESDILDVLNLYSEFYDLKEGFENGEYKDTNITAGDVENA